MVIIETLNQLKLARMYTRGRLKQSVGSAWDIQPEGFNNTIRWNVGHIYVVIETLIQKAIPEYEAVHAEWIPLFMPGSSPSKWETEAPSNEALLTALKEQSDRISLVIEDRLSDMLPKPVIIGGIHTMQTVEAVVQFVVWHEGVHAGIIDALNKVTAE